MKAHKHAALMLQYAQDAMETEHPELLWERRRPGEEWHPFDKGRQPSWDPDLEYRRKPCTLTYTVTMPEPMRDAPELLGTYWLVQLSGEYCTQMYWHGNEWEFQCLKRGLCFATKEDAIAAAKAMLPIKGEEV